MKEGLLTKVKGKIFPYDDYEMYLYGYDNRYGLIVRRALIANERLATIDADKGLYELTPVGIGLKASEIIAINETNSQELIESLNHTQCEAIINAPELKKFKDNIDNKYYYYNSIAKEDIDLFLQVISCQEERQAIHVVEDETMNPYYTIEEAVKKYGVKSYEISEEENQYYAEKYKDL